VFRVNDDEVADMWKWARVLGHKFIIKSLKTVLTTLGMGWGGVNMVWYGMGWYGMVWKWGYPTHELNRIG